MDWKTLLNGYGRRCDWWLFPGDLFQTRGLRTCDYGDVYCLGIHDCARIFRHSVRFGKSSQRMDGRVVSRYIRIRDDSIHDRKLAGHHSASRWITSREYKKCSLD